MKKTVAKYILATILTALMTVIYSRLKLMNDELFNRNFKFTIPVLVLVVLSLTLIGAFLACGHTLLEDIPKSLAIKLKLCAVVFWIVVAVWLYFVFYSALVTIHLIIVGYSIGDLIFLLKASSSKRE